MSSILTMFKNLTQIQGHTHPPTPFHYKLRFRKSIVQFLICVILITLDLKPLVQMASQFIQIQVQFYQKDKDWNRKNWNFGKRASPGLQTAKIWRKIPHEEISILPYTRNFDFQKLNFWILIWANLFISILESKQSIFDLFVILRLHP